MHTFKILIEGYARPGENGEYIASPTTVLIYEGNKKIIVDPGANYKLLEEAFQNENIKPEEIDIVYLTHYHPDHFLNIRFFPKKDIYDGSMIWSSDTEINYSKKIPGTDIEVIPTPGHCAEHTSLIINTKDKGVVCIAQDVFWWEDGKQKSDTVEDLMNNSDPFITDWTELQKSRKLVLEKADWIIPGHGRMFKNPS